MPSSKFVVSSVISQSFRCEKIKGTFDLCGKENIEKQFNVDIPIEGKEWNIGLIVGSSGTGKTTIAKKLFSDFYLFDGFVWKEKSLLDDFDKKFSSEEIVDAISKAGLSSAPDWFKPFSVLSNGQKMRAEMARLMLEIEKPVVYDEFTSVVDRQVAKITSYAVSRYVKKNKKKFIALSCHRDIIDWIEPDWVFDTDTNHFSWGLLRRPNIEINIREAKYQEWQIFKDYHYLTSEHNKAARCYLAEIEGTPVAWCSILHFPHLKNKNIKRIHRLVVRPDYQGVGIGSILLDFVAEFYKEKGFRVLITTSLKNFMLSLSKNHKWMLRQNGRMKISKTMNRSFFNSFSCNRLVASFAYMDSE